MDENIRDYRKKLIFVYIIISIVVLIVTNSFRSIGHEVKDYSFGSGYVTNYVGYSKNDRGYHVTDDNHYITVKHDQESNESTFILKEKLKRDTCVYIWYMTNDGSVIDEYETTWESGHRCFLLTEIPEGVAYISYRIDVDFQLYGNIVSNSYNKLVLKLLLYLVESIIIVASFIVVYRNRLFRDRINRISIRRINITKKKVIRFGLFLIMMCGCALLIYILGLLFPDNRLLFHNKKLFMLVLALMCYGFFLLVNKKCLLAKIETLFAITLFIVGTLYAYLFPSSFGVSWDDHIHYKNACSIVRVIDYKKSFADYGLNNDLLSVANERLTFDRKTAKEKEDFYDWIESEGYFVSENSNSISYGTIVYIPSALGLIISKGLMLPYHFQIIFGRWMNVLLLTVLTYFAMKKLKNGKIIVFLLMMSPTNMFISGNYNYDTWLIAWSILGLAYLFAEYQDKDSYITTKSSVIIAISMMLAILIKQVYFLLVVPALVISKKKFSLKKDRVLYYVLILLAIILPFVFMVINNIVNAGAGDTRGGAGVNSPEQLKFVVNNIGFVSDLFYNFLRMLLNPFRAGDGYLTMLGFGGVVMNLQIPLLAILSGCIICHESKKGTSFPIWYRLCMVLLYIAIGGIVSFAMYVAFTPVGADYIQGVQGRYMLPVFFPLVYVLTRIPVKEYIVTKIGRNKVYLFYTFLLIVINIYAIYKGCIRYY